MLDGLTYAGAYWSSATSSVNAASSDADTTRRRQQPSSGRPAAIIGYAV
jgi:hypothetical protein